MRPRPPLPLLLPFLLLLVLLPSPAAAVVSPRRGPAAWEALHTSAGRRAALPAEQEGAAAGVIRRLLPSHARSFRFQIDSKGGVCGESSCFMISQVDGSGKGGAEILRTTSAAACSAWRSVVQLLGPSKVSPLKHVYRLLCLVGLEKMGERN